jgi:serine/threonine protein kinase
MKFHLQVQERQVLVAQDYERNVAQEIAVLRRCGAAEHPGLVQLIGTFETESAIYMVLELGAGGDLHGVLARRGSLDEGAAAFYTAEIVSGLAALHAQAVVWGDLKPENVLLTGSGHVKLTDFGSATIVVNGGSGGPPPAGDQGASKVEGTAEYIAPEVAAGQPPSFESDAWALGCVLYQMLAGRTPVLHQQQLDAAARSELRPGRARPSSEPGAAAAAAAEELFATQREALRRLAAVSFVGVGSAGNDEGLFPAGFPSGPQNLVCFPSCRHARSLASVLRRATAAAASPTGAD